MLKTFLRRFRSNGRPSMRQLAGIVDSLSWQKVDALYDQCRLKLRTEPRWRYGSARIHSTAGEWLGVLQRHGGIAEKCYLDLGCGSHHPFGVSTVMYLNGASRAYAVDIQPTDSPRAARALFDLLSDCLCFPEKWCLAGTPDEFAARIRNFDLQALSEGDLARGTADIPIEHFVDDIKRVAVPAGSVDRFASRAVLEHFLDLPEACRVLHRMCGPAAVGVHHIDMRDHRAYSSPGRFHYWSFLTRHGTRPTADGTRSETYPRTDEDLTNRLRWHEVRNIFEEAGFEFLEVDLRKETLPEGLREQLVAPYDELTDDDLSVTGATFVVRRC